MSEPDLSLRGMVLAAGYGTRLAPLTDLVPKPLLPVGGRPLLDLAVANLDRAGVGKVVVNAHHLGAQVSTHLASRADAARFTLSHETEILGTGGALHGARGFLAGAAHFLLHNGDVLTDADLAALLALHRTSSAVATLLLVDCPSVNTVEVAADGAVLRLAGRPAATDASSVVARRLTYAGVGAFARRILDDVPEGASSLVDVLATLLAREPGAVRAWTPACVHWSDVGTFARWLDAQPDDREPAEAQPSPAVRIERIRGHGSDRRFWRLQCGAWSAVAMVSPPADLEHERFVALAAFLTRHDLGPAVIRRADDGEKMVLMEDLGQQSLHALAAGIAADEPAAVTAWELATDQITRLQAATEAALVECPVAFDRALDEAGLRWETDYFRERFLVGLMGLEASTLASLTPEFTALAAAVAAQPFHLLHRDYQSQNLLVKDGRLRLVDFQGLRPGPLGYDLASLLWDPYVSIHADRRRVLLNRYAVLVGEHLDPALTPDAVRAMVLAAALQRLLQALGAYGFLSVVKGRSGFLAHVPRGLAHLREVLGLVAGARAEALPGACWLPPPLPGLEAVLAGLDETRLQRQLRTAAEIPQG